MGPPGGAVKELERRLPFTVAALLRLLQEQDPPLAPYAGFGPQDRQPYGVLVWRGGKLLTLDDVLRPADELEIIAMASGG